MPTEKNIQSVQSQLDTFFLVFGKLDMEAHNCNSVLRRLTQDFQFEMSLGYIAKSYLKSSMENNGDTGQ